MERVDSGSGQAGGGRAVGASELATLRICDELNADFRRPYQDGGTWMGITFGIDFLKLR